MSRLAMVAAQAAEAVGERPFSFVWGVVVPGLILACSVVFTWMLYKHFSKSGH